jgi:hypothetical protein
VAVEHLAAGALHQRTRDLRRQLFAARAHRVLPLGPVALISPRLKICFCARRQDRAPCRFEVGARPLMSRRCRSGAGPVPCLDRSRRSSPIGLVDRAADTPCNRADMHVAKVDVPAVGTFGIATAGESGHGPFERDAIGSAIARAWAPWQERRKPMGLLTHRARNNECGTSPGGCGRQSRRLECYDLAAGIALVYIERRAIPNLG